MAIRLQLRVSKAQARIKNTREPPLRQLSRNLRFHSRWTYYREHAQESLQAERESQLLCYNCHNEGKVLVRDDHARSQKRKLMCADCEKPFDFDPSGHINEAMRKYHFSTKRTPVFCYACQEQRSTYTCTRCGQTRPRKDFQTRNFNRENEKEQLQCLECKDKKRESVHRQRL